MSKAGKLLNIGQFVMILTILLIVVSSTYDIDIGMLVGVTGMVLMLLAIVYVLIIASFPRSGG